MSKIYIVIGIVFSLLIGTLFLMKNQINTLKNENTIQLKKIGEQAGTITTNNQTINTLKQKNSDNQDALILLRQSSNQASNLIDKQSKELTRLTNENDQLKMWANTALPDDVIRLYSRPADIKGSENYRQFLSESRDLHATGKQAH